MEIGRALVGAVGVLAFAAGEVDAFAQAAGTPLVVLAYNYASAPDGVVQAATEKVTEIYRAAGVEVQWRAPIVEAREPAPTNAHAQTAFSVRMLIRPREAAWEPSRKAIMGVTVASDKCSGLVSVFYDAVMKVALQNRQPVADILGIAMAHEIGHVLLPQSSHTQSGIMRGAWDGGNVQEAMMGPLTLTSTQAELITQRLAHCCNDRK